MNILFSCENDILNLKSKVDLFAETLTDFFGDNLADQLTEMYPSEKYEEF